MSVTIENKTTNQETLPSSSSLMSSILETKRILDRITSMLPLEFKTSSRKMSLNPKYQIKKSNSSKLNPLHFTKKKQKKTIRLPSPPLTSSISNKRKKQTNKKNKLTN